MSKARNIKVLVVDDHQVVREGLRRILELDKEIEVVGEARSGEEAIAKATAVAPDVVIMDVRMPECNGVEATAALQQKLPQAKVLILTVSEENEDLFNAVRAGARGYLLKSAELDGIVSAIRVVAAGDVIITPVMAAKMMNELRHVSKNKTKDEVELSDRERQVTQLVAQGANNKEIAASLSVSEATVKAHLKAILEKLHVKNRAQAVAKAMAKGLLV